MENIQLVWKMCRRQFALTSLTKSFRITMAGDGTKAEIKLCTEVLVRSVQYHSQWLFWPFDVALLLVI
jgi:hypothetical protein